MALEHWRLLAACAPQPEHTEPLHERVDWWFPDRGESGSIDHPDEVDDDEAKDVERALADCARCRVRYVCLQENLWEPYGIWGGWQLGTRETIRRLGLDCPVCEVKIPPKAQPPRVFCSDECVVAASVATGDELELIEKRLEWQVQRAYLFNLKRREGLNAA